MYRSENHNMYYLIGRVAKGTVIFESTGDVNSNEANTFIENVIFGLPLLPILAQETKDGKYIILDGSKRLQTLLYVMENGKVDEQTMARIENTVFEYKVLECRVSADLVQRAKATFKC